MTGTSTIGSGPLRLRRTSAINGTPFTRFGQFYDACSRAKPGDQLHLSLINSSGKQQESTVPIRDQSLGSNAASNIALMLTTDLVVPVVALILGFSVALIRPRDLHAWLLLLLMISFSEVMRTSQWYGPGHGVTLMWRTFWSMTWAVWMLLFGTAFPARL